FTLDHIARHAGDFWLTTEDLPHPNNRVTLGRNGRTELHYSTTNLEPHRRLLGKLKGLLADLDMHPHLIRHQLIRDQRIPVAGVSHQCGTVRLGAHPATSALVGSGQPWPDRDGKRTSGRRSLARAARHTCSAAPRREQAVIKTLARAAL